MFYRWILYFLNIVGCDANVGLSIFEGEYIMLSDSLLNPFSAQCCYRNQSCNLLYQFVSLRLNNVSEIILPWPPYNTLLWKVSKCGVCSGPYFPVFSRNTGKYGPEKTAYLDTFIREQFYKNMNLNLSQNLRAN